MLQPSAFLPSQPPDLLRRFVPTPLKAIYNLDQASLFVHTNDFTLFPALPLALKSEVSDSPAFEWKLVRDEDTRGSLESLSILELHGLKIVEMGPACLLGVDLARRALLGFIGGEVDGRTYQDILVPLMCTLTKEMFCAESLANPIAKKKELVHE
jgi:hypothetical protein